MKKKILILTTSYPFDKGDKYGSFVEQQCRFLQKKGFDVTVLCPHHVSQKTKTKKSNVTIIRFKYFWPLSQQKVAYGSGIPTNLKKTITKLQLPFFFLFFAIQALKLSKGNTIIYSHWTIPTLIAIIVKKLRSNRKVFFFNHGAEFFVLKKNKLAAIVLKFIIKNCDAIISNSSYTYENTVTISPKKNHQIIPPGVDTNTFLPIKTQLRSKLSIGQHFFVVFALGNFIERKGFEYLIKAFNIIVNEKKETNIVAYLGGKGLLRDKYEQLITQYNLANHFKFTGFIAPQELVEYYNICNVFVLPAIVGANNDTEGLGVVLNEANACGTPIIGTNVGGIIDVIEPGENGYIIEEKNENQLAEVILKLKNNPALLQKLSEKSRQYAIKNFSWEKNIEKTINFTEQIMTGRS